MTIDINKLIKNTYLGKNKFAVILVDTDPLTNGLGKLISMKIKQNKKMATYIVDKDLAKSLVEVYNLKEFPVTLIFKRQNLVNKVNGFITNYSY